MGYAELAKIILPGLLAVALLGWIGYKIYDSGYKAADEKWTIQHNKEVNDLNAKINELEDDARKDASLIQQITMDSQKALKSIVATIPDIKLVDAEDKRIECPGRQELKIRLDANFTKAWNALNAETNKSIAVSLKPID